MQRERDINPSWTDFKPVRFTESHSSRLDGTKPSAHTDKLSNEDHTYVCTAEEHQRRECAVQEPEDHKRLILNSQGQNGPMKQREDYAEAININKRLYKESGGARPKILPANKYGKERINRSQDPVKDPNELTPKPDGNVILLQRHPARLRRGGNHLTNGGMHQLGMNSEWFSMASSL